VPGPGRSSAAGPFLSAVEHSSIFKGTLHEAAAGYAPKDPSFQNAFHTQSERGKSRSARIQKTPFCGAFAEPSDGLEPSTPSLP
jgi:hypothetical protein